MSSVASHFCFSVMKPAFRWEHVTFGCVEANVPDADEQRACLGHSNPPPCTPIGVIGIGMPIAPRGTAVSVSIFAR
jgi:hypothetical protein